MKTKKRFFVMDVSLGILISSLLFITSPGADEITRWKRQTVYVPIYSHIYIGDKELSYALAATLSIRNTDPAHPISVDSLDYLDSEGKLVRKYLTGPVRVDPLATIRYVIKESDMAGGSGAKFIVKWRTDKGVVSPIIESVMIGTRAQQGISFLSRGQVIDGEAVKP